MPVTATFARDERGLQFVGTQKVMTGRLTLAGTYDVGGFLAPPSLFGMGRVDSMGFPGMSQLSSTTANGASYFPATGRIKLYETAAVVDTAFDEVDAGNSVAGQFVDVEIKGA